MLTADKKGKIAEDKANLLLINRGYTIIQRRYKCPYGEIDLLATKGKTIVAVEVKYRKVYKLAAESLQPRQKKRLVETMQYFLSKHEDFIIKYPFIRFDVVLLSEADAPIHITNAWQDFDD